MISKGLNNRYKIQYRIISLIILSFFLTYQFNQDKIDMRYTTTEKLIFKEEESTYDRKNVRK